MTRHYPDLSGASDWLNQISHATRPIRSTTQIWVVTRHQYGISALVSQTSFGRKPVVASPNVGCFLRLEILVKNVCISDCKISLASSYYNWLRGTGENAAQGLGKGHPSTRPPVHPSTRPFTFVRRVPLGILGGAVSLRFPNPDPISDQKSHLSFKRNNTQTVVTNIRNNKRIV